MSEIIAYDTDFGKPLHTIDKAESHRLCMEAQARGEPAPHKHKHLGVMLFDGLEKIITSVRDFDASHNADMMDKTLGGHIPTGFDAAAALLKVSSREYKVPIAIVSKEELAYIVLNHPELVKRQAFITEVDYDDNYVSERAIGDDKTFNELCIQQVFVGVYDGPYKCEDDGTAIRVASLDKVRGYMSRKPGKVTGDFKTFMAAYDHEIASVVDLIARSNALEGKDTAEELVAEFDMDGIMTGTVARKKAHHAIRATARDGEPQEVKHSHIGGLLIGSDGQIYVQIRSENKAENPGMYDKIVGGHIPLGDSPTVAAYHEFLEEMRIPVALYSEVTWKNILKNCPDAINTQAICLHPVLKENFPSYRERADGDSFTELCDQYITIGYYDGDFGFTDKEAAGIYQFPSREALKDEITQHPEKFTADLKFLVGEYWDQLVPLEQRIAK